MMMRSLFGEGHDKNIEAVLEVARRIDARCEINKRDTAREDYGVALYNDELPNRMS
jgi:hypothetical protein